MNDSPERVRGIVAFDLDGTLLRGDTACEILAKPIGRLDEMQRFETFTSEADIIRAREQMAKWYGEHSPQDLAAFLNDVRWAPGVHEAVQRLHEEAIVVGIASLTWSFAVRWCAERLGISHCLGTDLSSNGEIRHVWGRDKARWLQELADSYGIAQHRVAAVGDSGGDSEMLRVAGMRFFVGAHPIPAVASIIHMPAADLRDVAEGIIHEWAA